MEIGPFIEADRAMVVDLWRRCGLVVPHNDPDRDIDLCLRDGHATILVGRIEGTPVATAMVGDDGHRGWIYYVAVEPTRQGRGLGRRIVAAAEERLRARGIPKVQLMVRATNSGVAGFYDRLGYEETPRLLLAKWLR